MKTFALILRRDGAYYFRAQEPAPRLRCAGAIIADASLENAAYYIARRLADLYVGPETPAVEWLQSCGSNQARISSRKVKTKRDKKKQQ